MEPRGPARAGSAKKASHCIKYSAQITPKVLEHKQLLLLVEI